MSLQTELFYSFRQLPARNKVLDAYFARWQCIGAIRRMAQSISMGLFIAQQSRDVDIFQKLMPLLDLAITAHVTVIGLPLIISINGLEIRQNPVLHAYYSRFPSYREQIEDVLKLIKEKRQIEATADGINALLEYFNLPDLTEIRDALVLQPQNLLTTVFNIIVRRTIDIIDDAVQTVQMIVGLIRADDPALNRHILTVALGYIMNPLHDADFAMNSAMILSAHSYEETFTEMARADAPRPFLHHGTSRFWGEMEPGRWELLKTFAQPLEREITLVLTEPPFPIATVFEHEADHRDPAQQALVAWSRRVWRRGLWSDFNTFTQQPIAQETTIETTHSMTVRPN